MTRHSLPGCDDLQPGAAPGELTPQFGLHDFGHHGHDHGIVIRSRPGSYVDAIQAPHSGAGRSGIVASSGGIDVFELTGRAAAALAERRAQNGLADSIAIRISTSDSDNGSSAGYQLRFVSNPSPDDVVVESVGTRVFLAAGLAEPLEAAILDVVDTAKRPQLVLKGGASPGG